LKNIKAFLDASPPDLHEPINPSIPQSINPEINSTADEIIRRFEGRPENLIAILQAFQRKWRYLPSEALQRLSETTDITPARIEGVATFYKQFRLRPAGRHTIRICVGTACHVKGSDKLIKAVYRELEIPENDDTSPDRTFTVEKVACLGCCTLAPVIVIDETTYGHMTPENVGQVIRGFLKHESEIGGRKPAGPSQASVKSGMTEIRIGLGSCCVASGDGNVMDAFQKALTDHGVNASVKRVGCVGMCHNTPLVEVVTPEGDSQMYAKVRPLDASQIVQRHFPSHGLLGRIKRSLNYSIDRLLTDEVWEPVANRALHTSNPSLTAFKGLQKHVALEHCGNIDPASLDEYLKYGGFASSQRCLKELSPDRIIDIVTRSGLRGRGGAGFPTGLKWKSVRTAKGDEKYIVLNGDEGDPGAFMDRMLLESFPYRIIEGMIIAAYAVGAGQGILYIREEYPLAVIRVQEAIRHCMERGFLGGNLFGTGFSLQLRIMQGAGAFVCGEETALLASLEGKRGMPRMRPPYPADKGFLGNPTLINNVETFANIPWILQNGSDAFASVGTEKSKGTKVFALAGKVNRGGLIEVPMGSTIRQIVEQIGGGVAEGRKFKAVQIGGPSGGCIPASLCDTPVDFETLTAQGAIMGSGGLIVLDDTDCMVDMARYFLSFTQDQSCGRCTPCRIGTRRMLDILERLCRGEGETGDIEKLEALALTIRKSSLCGLGRTAPSPVLSTIRHYRDEYEAHINGKCPAGKCEALIKYTVTEKCIGCTLCAQICPVDAIAMKPYEKHEIDDKKCVRCGACKKTCPAEAIEVG
jgi:NADH:ubiquinone oxidoreductase subunit F (NADH-binding)/NADH:ubiquinone oxidoreductase subunit E/NAD-dependent dihydropyrimidine dehydrogenase PreA subunit